MEIARKDLREEDAAVEGARGGGDDKVGLKIWGNIRPSLWPVEEVMRYQLKNVNGTDDPTVSGLVNPEDCSDLGKEINAYENESEKFKSVAPEGFSVVQEETKLSKDQTREESNAIPHDIDHNSNDRNREESCSWKDELDALVQGGVPMALRGEVVSHNFEHYF